MGRRRGIPSGTCDAQCHQACDGESAFCRSWQRERTPSRKFPGTCQYVSGPVQSPWDQLPAYNKNEIKVA